MIRVDEHRGALVEMRYERRGAAYFSPIARRIRPLSPDQLDEMIDAAQAAGSLSEFEATQIRLADVLFRGLRRTDDAEVVLVVEASGVIDNDDVERVATRASLVQRTGAAAIPVVAGDRIGDRARGMARHLRVWIVLDGQVEPPDAA